MSFEIQTHGLCFSRHETMAEAEAALAKAKAEEQENIDRLMEQVYELEDFIAELNIQAV